MDSLRRSEENAEETEELSEEIAAEEAEDLPSEPDSMDDSPPNHTTGEVRNHAEELYTGFPRNPFDLHPDPSKRNSNRWEKMATLLNKGLGCLQDDTRIVVSTIQLQLKIS